MKLGDNEWAQEVGLARSNDRMAGWYGDAESRKNKNTYERGTAAYYMMMAGESAPDLALTFGSTGLARGILKGAVKKAVVREGIGAAAKEAAEQTARAAGKTAAEVAAAGKVAEKMAVRGHRDYRRNRQQPMPPGTRWRKPYRSGLPSVKSCAATAR